MTRLTTLSILMTILLWFLPDSAQSHDYFTADQDPGIQTYLRIVDANHTEKVLGWVQQGRIGNAIDDLKYTLDRFPNHPKALMLMGSVAKITKKIPLAIAYYEKAIKLFPEYALTQAQYGAYLVDIGNTQAGIGKLKKAIEMDPKLAQAHAWLAKAYYKSGNPELGRQEAGQAAALGYKSKIQ